MSVFAQEFFIVLIGLSGVKLVHEYNERISESRAIGPSTRH